MEAEATETLLNLIQMDNIGELLINLLLMALLPALGEELVFRGVVQQYGYALFKRKTVSVWLTALLFSAIHFQFEGFIPRFLLGLVLGYLFYWTNQILIPIILHFANNAIMVTASYSLPAEDLKLDQPMVNEIPVYLVIGAIVLMIPLAGYFIRHQKTDSS
jgi:membrane protease YdiL (CAAX protease family)